MTEESDASAGQTDASRLSRRPRFESARVLTDGGSSSDSDRNRILRELRGELARHPAVRTIEGKPSDEYRELRATVTPAWFGRQAEGASLRVAWIPDPSPGPETSDRASDTWMGTPIRASYSLHYSESTGFDCGFHCEPNPHVDGLLHYQERDSTDSAYTYEPVSFSARSASALLWELMDALSDRLEQS